MKNGQKMINFPRAKFSHKTKKHRNFADAWFFLLYHPAFKNKYGVERFGNCLHIDLGIVNPLTRSIEDDKNLNTKVEVWLECGMWLEKEDFPEDERQYIKPEGESIHDVNLDCGANTFKQAIIILAKKVLKYYGDYKNNYQVYSPKERNHLYLSSQNWQEGN